MHVVIRVVRADRILLCWDARPSRDLVEQVRYLVSSLTGVDGLEQRWYTTVIDVATHVVHPDLLALEIMNTLLDDEVVADRAPGALDVQLLTSSA